MRPHPRGRELYVCDVPHHTCVCWMWPAHGYRLTSRSSVRFPPEISRSGGPRFARPGSLLKPHKSPAPSRLPSSPSNESAPARKSRAPPCGVRRRSASRYWLRLPVPDHEGIRRPRLRINLTIGDNTSKWFTSEWLSSRAWSGLAVVSSFDRRYKLQSRNQRDRSRRTDGRSSLILQSASFAGRTSRGNTIILKSPVNRHQSSCRFTHYQ
jgi:hypothetical protein